MVRASFLVILLMTGCAKEADEVLIRVQNISDQHYECLTSRGIEEQSFGPLDAREISEYRAFGQIRNIPSGTVIVDGQEYSQWGFCGVGLHFLDPGKYTCAARVYRVNDARTLRLSLRPD